MRKTRRNAHSSPRRTCSNTIDSEHIPRGGAGCRMPYGDLLFYSKGMIQVCYPKPIPCSRIGIVRKIHTFDQEIPAICCESWPMSYLLIGIRRYERWAKASQVEGLDILTVASTYFDLFCTLCLSFTPFTNASESTLTLRAQETWGACYIR